MTGFPPAPEFQILIADDDPGIRSFLRRGLRLEGYGVIEADSGEVAVRLTREAKPDLVILDWMMPGIDGPESSNGPGPAQSPQQAAASPGRWGSKTVSI